MLGYVFDDNMVDDEFAMLCFLAYSSLQTGGLLGPRRPHRRVVYKGYRWVNDTLEDEVQCFNMFRMTPAQFLTLHDLLVTRYNLKGGRSVTTKEALGMFLWIVGGSESNRQAQNRFGRCGYTISHYFRNVLNALYNLGVDIIRPRDPNFSTVHQRMRSRRFSPWWNDCIGAIDGTHIRIEVAPEPHLNYIGRHGVPTLNFIAVVDHSARFIFTNAAEGHHHDSTVLRTTLHLYGHRFPHPPEGKFYAVDSAYSNTTGYLAPFRNVRYHLQNFSARVPANIEEVFNYRHSQVRVVVERAFGMLKNKFRILRSIPNYGLFRQRKIVVACMALHNFILDNNGDPPGFTHGAGGPADWPEENDVPVPDYIPPPEDTQQMAMHRYQMAVAIHADFHGH